MANLPAGVEPAVTIRTLSHTQKSFVGDTDHWTKLETSAKSAEQNRVRGVETVGGRERAEIRGSETGDAASRATAGDE